MTPENGAPVPDPTLTERAAADILASVEGHAPNAGEFRLRMNRGDLGVKP